MTYVSKLENSICKSDAHSLAVACIHLGRVKAIKITWIWTSRRVNGGDGHSHC